LRGAQAAGHAEERLMSVRVLTGDCRDIMRAMPAESVDCIVTSPPYWGLRDYGVAGQLGLEPTLGEHIATMVDVFEAAKRVLKKTGTLWLNYGDSYAASVNGRSAADTKAVGHDDRTFRDKPFGTIGPIFRPGNLDKNGGNSNRDGMIVDKGSRLKPKDLCMVPNRLAIALQEAGWWVRSEIIWHKPNPMPESVRDRPTSSHEKIWLLTKSERYFYDAEAIAEESIDPESLNGRNPRNDDKFAQHDPQGFARTRMGFAKIEPGRLYLTRNRRNVWTIPSQPFSEAHFATFPPALIEPCILAGTSEKGCCAQCSAPWVRNVEIETRPNAEQNCVSQYNGYRGISGGVGNDRRSRIERNWQPSCACNAGIVSCTILDPFGGSGTVGLVADRLGRNAILIELNPVYADMAKQRIVNDLPLFAAVEVAAP
jgi:DNA modification methylase